MILREVVGAKPGDLFDEIEEVLPKLPPYLQDLHNIRDVGNFAVHPNKNKHTGEMVDVEPGEAEWLLDILDNLFSFYFVEPERKKKREVDWKNKKSGPKP